MTAQLATLLVAPGEKHELKLTKFNSDGDGCLVNSDDKHCFPVYNGVPVFLENAFTKSFVEIHAQQLSKLGAIEKSQRSTGKIKDWSFSREWDEHFDTDSARTWGYTVEERFEQFLLECQVSREELKSMRVLDAGCGNGALTDRIAEECKDIVGLDYSSGVHHAQKHRKSDNSLFIQGDLLDPPIADESFDLVFSIGVLHHTPSTRKAFDQVSKLVKPGGKFYFWLYRRPENFFGRLIKVPIYDTMRWVTSRLPAKMQDFIVHSYARLVHSVHSLRKGGAPVPLREYVVSAYDDLSCRWRYYHHPVEVARWLHEAGFAPPVLTHWDNPYGFGVVAERLPQEHTPGISYGDGVKLWDPDQTVLGRLHKD